MAAFGIVTQFLERLIMGRVPVRLLIPDKEPGWLDFGAFCQGQGILDIDAKVADGGAGREDGKTDNPLRYFNSSPDVRRRLQIGEVFTRELPALR